LPRVRAWSSEQAGRVITTRKRAHSSNTGAPLHHQPECRGGKDVTILKVLRKQEQDVGWFPQNYPDFCLMPGHSATTRHHPHSKWHFLKTQSNFWFRKKKFITFAQFISQLPLIFLQPPISSLASPWLFM
jgi:hypothetical protein